MTNKNWDVYKEWEQFYQRYSDLKDKLIEIPEANPYHDISGLTEEEVTQDE